jgi:hypothetical protein
VARYNAAAQVVGGIFPIAADHAEAVRIWLEGRDTALPPKAPGPLSGADQSNVIFMIYALLYATLTTFARSVIILIFEVVLVDCPKSWSGLLALGAARVLGIQDAEAFITFLCTAEMMFTEQDGIVWAAEPQLRFFIHFLNAALHANVPVVVNVGDYAVAKAGARLPGS